MSFPPKHAAERVYLGTDWSAALDTGETIVSATVTMRARRNRDANAAAMVQGQPTVDGAIVSQLVVDGVAGVEYESVWRVVTSIPRTLEERVPLLVL